MLNLLITMCGMRLIMLYSDLINHVH